MPESAPGDEAAYDRMNSPILWVNETADDSPAGAKRAIPAEHTFAVLEVKAALTLDAARDLKEKLQELRPLLGVNTEAKYPENLPGQFISGAIFIEARKRDGQDSRIPNELVLLDRGFTGAMILGGEGRHENDTGRVKIIYGENRDNSNVPKNPLGDWADSDIVLRDGLAYNAMITWAPVEFSMFAFDLLAHLTRTFRLRFISSFHGFPPPPPPPAAAAAPGTPK